MTSVFEFATTRTRQGDIGEARAIYEYTRLGYTVSRTLFDSAKYELVIERDGEIQRVQVRTTTQKNRYGAPLVQLSTSGGNTKVHTKRLRQDEDYDILFVLTDDNDCWSIPTTAFTARCELTVNPVVYAQYKIG